MTRNWGLLAVGAAVLVTEAMLIVRDWRRGAVSIQARSFRRAEQPALFTIGVALHAAWIVAGGYALKAGLNL